MDNSKKRPMGRQPTGNYNIEKMCEIIDDYTDETYVPILKEVCYRNNWCYQYIQAKLRNSSEKLDNSIKRLLDKKEADLERGGLTGELNKTVVLFSLKQLGWKDRVEIEDISKRSEDRSIKVEFVDNSVKD